eukprot:Rhum_TRINITY_DN14343_c15_g1::Rhum_TRINITY_DN14343_c15_g1_i1::g.83903::m.83903
MLSSFSIKNAPPSGSLVFSLFFSVLPRVSVRRHVFSCSQAMPFLWLLFVVVVCLTRSTTQTTAFAPRVCPPPPCLFSASRSKATVPGHSVCRAAVAFFYPPAIPERTHCLSQFLSPPPPLRAAAFPSYLCPLFPKRSKYKENSWRPSPLPQTQNPKIPHTLLPTSTIQEIREWKRAGWSQILPSSPVPRGTKATRHPPPPTSLCLRTEQSNHDEETTKQKKTNKSVRKHLVLIDDPILPLFTLTSSHGPSPRFCAVFRRNPMPVSSSPSPPPYSLHPPPCHPLFLPKENPQCSLLSFLFRSVDARVRRHASPMKSLHHGKKR